jgi:hypothetical protein
MIDPRFHRKGRDFKPQTPGSTDDPPLRPLITLISILNFVYSYIVGNNDSKEGGISG